MNRSLDEEIKLKRVELWIKVCAATAGANDCKSKHAPVNWANNALKEFDTTFNIRDYQKRY